LQALISDWTEQGQARNALARAVFFYLWRSSAKVGAGKLKPLRPLANPWRTIFRFMRRPT